MLSVRRRGRSQSVTREYLYPARTVKKKKKKVVRNRTPREKSESLGTLQGWIKPFQLCADHCSDSGDVERTVKREKTEPV
ncbi:hypothetical protein GJAV_G00065310 [Gymnothorax javanicus]|nr:hypothetical protein GJAV_G00065310 [Gymnothorax javanicus]